MKAHDFLHEEHELDSPFLNELQWEDESPFLHAYYEVAPASPFLEREAFEAEEDGYYGRTPYGEEEYGWADYEEEGPEEDFLFDEEEAYLLGGMSGECEQEDCAPELEVEEWEEEHFGDDEYDEEGEIYHEYAETGEWEAGDDYEDQETSDVITETYDHNEVEARPGNDFTESELEELFLSLDKLGGWVKGRLASRVQAFPITDLTVVPRKYRERTLEEALSRGVTSKKTGEKIPTHTVSRSITSPRDLNTIDAVVLHHTAFKRGNAFEEYYKVVSHYIVLPDGKIGMLWGPEVVLNASNRFNRRSVAIEFAGNFPNDKNKWWDGDNAGRHCPTDAQIKAGRFLLQHLKQAIPGIRYVFAHRQSSAGKPDDPGPDIWFNVAEFAIKYLGYSEDSSKVKVGDGQVIPESWKNWGSKTNKKCSPSTSIPLPAGTEGGTEGAAGKQPVAPPAGNSNLKLPIVATHLPDSVNYVKYKKGETGYYGTPEIIAALEWIGREWRRLHPSIKFRIGDISLKGGGEISGHASHRIGLDVDVNLEINGKKILTGREEPPKGKEKRELIMHESYKEEQRPFVREFIKVVLQNPHLSVKTIGFRDPGLIKEFPKGTISDWNGHHDHLHIRFCMPEHRKAQLDLSKAYSSGEKEGNYSCSEKTMTAPAVPEPASTEGAGNLPGALASHLTGLMNKGVIGLSVFTAIMAGERDANKLTDLIFFHRHPERNGRKIGKDEEDASREWNDIRAAVVWPLLRAISAGALASGGGTTTAVAASGGTTQSTGLPANLGILKIDTSQPGLGQSFPEYHFTPEDALWLARFVIGEAGGRNDKDNHAVIWAMFNRFGTLRHRVKSWTSFAQFLQLYSTPLQHPYVKSVGTARRIWENNLKNPNKFPVEDGQETYKVKDKATGALQDTGVKKVQYRRHIELQQKPWSSIKPEVRDMVVKIMRGEIPNPGIGLATDFASTTIFFRSLHKKDPSSYEEWRKYTINYASGKKQPPIAWIGEVNGIDQMKNAFFIRKSFIGLPASAVRIVTS